MFFGGGISQAVLLRHSKISLGKYGNTQVINMTCAEKARQLVSHMALEEKASLCSGKNFWCLKGISRLNLPEIQLTDGPHGLRKQYNDFQVVGISASIPAVCFPTAAATACSWDTDLLYQIGKAIAEECRQEQVSVLLGPGINIKRSPLCGRNFEYFSEDPYITGRLATAFIQGVQEQNVGVSLKHFAANNQETRRLTIDAVMDERTLREIYLSAFEYAVKTSQPWTVMCSYNQVFGEFASENKWLLNNILREEWGFEGLVVSDWGAVVDRVKGLKAGLDLEMPYKDEQNDLHILQAVRDGTLEAGVLDATAQRITQLILRAQERASFQYDAETHHALARAAATRSAVLLKNKGGLLPGNALQNAAIIGDFAVYPRYQGSGSSRVNPIKLDNPCEEMQQLGLHFNYARGYNQMEDDPDDALIQEACQVAEGKDIVYIFAGLPDRYESEGYDRVDMAMPENQNKLVESVCAVNPNVVVVLLCGAPVELPWADKVQAILLMYLGGEAAGGAAADLLLGKVSPSGKLAESWPLKLEDNPSFNYFPGFPQTVEYREGLFVGYRYYDTAQKAVRFPFGYGLTYTNFEYSDIQLSQDHLSDSDTLTVACTVRNIGKIAGAEIVQLYVHCQNSVIIRPEQELKGFVKVALQAGESQQIVFKLTNRDFAYYNTEIHDWHMEDANYEIRIGASSRDIRLRAGVHFSSNRIAPLPDYRELTPCYYDLSDGIQVSDKEFSSLIGKPIPARQRDPNQAHTINSTMTDIQDRLIGRQLLKIIKKATNKMADQDPQMSAMAQKMMMDMPLRFFSMKGKDTFSTVQVEGLVDLLNGKYGRGLQKLRKKASKKTVEK